MGFAETAGQRTCMQVGCHRARTRVDVEIPTGFWFIGIVALPEQYDLTPWFLVDNVLQQGAKAR